MIEIQVRRRRVSPSFPPRQTRRGFAFAVVLSVGTVLLILVGILISNSRSQKVALSKAIDQAKALAAAQSMMNLAIYKYRVLKPEFNLIENATPTLIPHFQAMWVADFDAKLATTPARVLKEKLGCEDIGVSTFSRLILPGEIDSDRDILRIISFAVVNGQRKTLQEMIEVKIQR